MIYLFQNELKMIGICLILSKFAQRIIKEGYEKEEQHLSRLLYDSDGRDEVVIYIENPKSMKRLGKNRCVSATPQLLSQLYEFLGETNVKVVEKKIENA